MIPLSQPSLHGKEKEYVLDALESGWLSASGPYVRRFEEAFAEYIGTKHAVSTCNGTAALHLALLGLTLGGDTADKVFVPDLTFPATANAVLHTGATAIFVDVDPNTWLLPSEGTDQKPRGGPFTMITVHLYGAIAPVPKHQGVSVIEDCAQSLGSEIDGRKTGSLGKIGAFSFHSAKTITTGEGGMLTTDDDDLAEQCRILRDHGMNPDKKFDFLACGYNYRMTNIQAALGLAQLERIDDLIADRRRVRARYYHWIGWLPHQSGLADPGVVPWLYSVLLPDTVQRDEILATLASNGIEARPVFPPLHTLRYCRSAMRGAQSTRIATHGISLPLFSDMTDAQVDYVCAKVDRAIAEAPHVDERRFPRALDPVGSTIL